METEKESSSSPLQNDLGDKSKIQWDMIKCPEPNGKDNIQDGLRSQTIMQALADGFEPFAIMPQIEKADRFSQETLFTNWIYMKRPSLTSLLIDETTGGIQL